MMTQTPSLCPFHTEWPWHWERIFREDPGKMQQTRKPDTMQRSNSCHLKKCDHSTIWKGEPSHRQIHKHRKHGICKTCSDADNGKLGLEIRTREALVCNASLHWRLYTIKADFHHWYKLSSACLFKQKRGHANSTAAWNTTHFLPGCRKPSKANMGRKLHFFNMQLSPLTMASVFCLSILLTHRVSYTLNTASLYVFNKHSE